LNKGARRIGSHGRFRKGEGEGGSLNREKRAQGSKKGRDRSCGGKELIRWITQGPRREEWL